MMWIGQPKLLGKLEGKFEEIVKFNAHIKAPGAPGSAIIWAKEEDPVISPDKQKLYCLGVGISLPCEALEARYCKCNKRVEQMHGQGNSSSFQRIDELIKFVVDTNIL